jgi:hypothetical protein
MVMIQSRFEFYRCPTDGHILVLSPGDDKAMCNCGKRNPKVPTELRGLHVVKTGEGRSVVLLEQVSFQQAMKEGAL